MSDDFELVHFDPEHCRGTNFSGWLNPKTKRAVFISRMHHFKSVMDDGDFYDAKPDDLGPTYGFPRSRIEPLMPEEIYDLMFSEGWVRFYCEHSPAGTLIMEGRDEKVLRGAANFARISGYTRTQVHLNLRETYDCVPRRYEPA